jgi:hypothetical protein
MAELKVDCSNLSDWQFPTENKWDHPREQKCDFVLQWAVKVQRIRENKQESFS